MDSRASESFHCFIDLVANDHHCFASLMMVVLMHQMHLIVEVPETLRVHDIGRKSLECVALATWADGLPKLFKPFNISDINHSYEIQTRSVPPCPGD